MTELEQYKRAYATLVGRVDTVIEKLRESEALLNLEKTGLRSAADNLVNALQEAEEIIVADGE